ncbi:MAG: AAA family ATPase [Candidatus Peregrinibacteria bacterium]
MAIFRRKDNPSAEPPPGQEPTKGPPPRTSADVPRRVETEPVTGKLRLTAEGKSENPIEGGYEGIEDVLEVGEYTILCTTGKIIVLDGALREIQTFPGGGKKEMVVDWQTLLPRLGRPSCWKFTEGKPTTGYLPVRELPLLFRRVAQGAIERLGTEEGKNRTVDIGGEACAMPLGKSVLSLPNDRYLFVTEAGSGTNGFCVYDTRPHSVLEHPKNWVRLSIGAREDSFPQWMKDARGRMSVRTSHERPLVDLPSDTAVRVTADGVEFLQQGSWEKAQGGKLDDRTVAVGDNIAFHAPKNLLVYMTGDHPSELTVCRTEGDAGTWKEKKEIRKLPSRRGTVSHLKIDPTGSFLLFTEDGKNVILDFASLEEVDASALEGLNIVSFDHGGRLCAIGKDGHLGKYRTNFVSLSSELQVAQVARMAANVDATKYFGSPSQKGVRREGAAIEQSTAAFGSLRQTLEPEFLRRISVASTPAAVQEVEQALALLRSDLKTRQLTDEQVTYVTAGIEGKLRERRTVIADTTVNAVMAFARERLQKPLTTFAQVQALQVQMETARSVRDVISPNIANPLDAVMDEFDEKRRTFYREHSAELLRDIGGILEAQKQLVAGITSKPAFDRWIDQDFPPVKTRFLRAQMECPSECAEARAALGGMVQALTQLAADAERKFEEEYESVREQAADEITGLAEFITGEIDQILTRLEGRRFQTRAEAESFVGRFPALDELRSQMEILRAKSSSDADKVRDHLENRISRFLHQIERQEGRKVDEAGKQVETFGGTDFEIFEGKAKEEREERKKRSVDVTFKIDEKIIVPGADPDQYRGDVLVQITTARGVQTIRPWEGQAHEEEYRRGYSESRGERFRSFMTAAEFREFRKEWIQWSKSGGPLKREYEEKRQALKEYYAKRADLRLGKRAAAGGAAEAGWDPEHYKQLLADFSKFCAGHSIALIRRIEAIASAENPMHANGRGMVPEWQDHWVSGPEDEERLGTMAKFFNQQLDLQSGCLNLKGHAGTGKDVLMRMFAARARRPLFTVDCTKWTDEYSLSADLILESSDGATQTIELPSVVLDAIQTPGAILYFNEINGMTDQARIFLHSLMDEKRELSIKVRSTGRTVKVHPSVIIASSMNPGYPGTFEPQAATRSRWTEMNVNYAPLTRPADKKDANQQPVYTVSDALKIARSTQSFREASREQSLERNAFVRMWDAHVNRHGVAELTPPQKFDMNAIVALTQFAHAINTRFMLTIDDPTKAMENQEEFYKYPLSLRELRLCANALGRMTDEEKGLSDAVQTARDLINLYYIGHYDNVATADKIRAAMKLWQPATRLGP